MNADMISTIDKLHKGVCGYEFSLTNLCNLKCRGCIRMCPLTTYKTMYKYTFEQFVKDFDKLYSITPTLEWICLSGGEPLLHPQICKILKYIRSKTSCYVSIFTNGKNLHNMSDEFYSVCRDNEIHIVYTYYKHSNIDYNFSDIKDKLYFIENFDRAMKYNFPSDDYGIPRDRFELHQFDMKKHDGKSLYLGDCLFTCPIVTPTRLNKCPYYINIESYKDRYKDMSYLETCDGSDYLTIENISSLDEIIEFYKTPSKFCDNCLHKPTYIKWCVEDYKEDVYRGKTINE